MSESRIHTTEQKFKDTIRRHNLWTTDDKLLLGLSGGIDSVALAHLTLKSTPNVTFTHINYNLRGQESDQDQAFVESLAKEWGCPILIKSVATKDYALNNKLTTQVAARELRYNWWEELAREHQFTRILTAHHADDQLETILLFLLRGGSFGSFKGIPLQRGHFVRPLLFHTKLELIKYLQVNKIAWREDSSNLEDAYLRNQIRHQIIPGLKTLNPELVIPVAKGASEHQAVWDAALWACDKIKPLAFEFLEDQFSLNFITLQTFQFKSYLIHTWLSPLGFNRDQLERMMTISPEKDTKTLIFETDHWLAIYSQGVLKGEPKGLFSKPIHKVWRHLNEKIVLPQGTLYAEKADRPDTYIKEPDTLLLDSHLWDFPLTVRTWQAGDLFHPLSMKGKKKIKALLNEHKIHVLDRKKILLLCKDETILWVIGIRKSNQHVLIDSPGPKIRIIWTHNE
jgi:tRNA(Ile)-lysidine synthase